MTDHSPSHLAGLAGTKAALEIDVGLRQFLLRVYNYMAFGLTLTGTVAYAAAESGLYAWLSKTPLLLWGVVLTPLALVLFLSFRIEKMSLGAAQACLLGLCRPDRTVASSNLRCLHRGEHCSDLFHHGGNVPRDEFLDRVI